jgi:hypothetical protein
MKTQLAADPLLKGSFIGAFYNKQPIPVSQALDILKQ